MEGQSALPDSRAPATGIERPRPNLILAGFMATGKTTVGREAARRLGMEFVDMDEIIEGRAGKPIPRIFSEDGEPAFRQLEAALAEELAGREGLVVAAGGGCLLRESNRNIFQQTGVVVCLWASAEEVLRRTAGDNNRPLLPQGGVERIRALQEERGRAYAALPHHIDTTGVAVEEVVRRVIEVYWGAAGSEGARGEETPGVWA